MCESGMLVFSCMHEILHCQIALIRRYVRDACLASLLNLHQIEWLPPSGEFVRDGFLDEEETM